MSGPPERREHPEVLARGATAPILAYDVGGTSLRAAIYAPGLSGGIVRAIEAPTPNHLRYPDESADQIRARLFAAMRALAAELLGSTNPGAVSAALPGPIDRAGRVLGCPTVWGDRDGAPFPIRQALGELFPGARLCVLNDVTAAGYRYLAEHGPDLCVVTVSSGIGHKVFIRGEPALGPSGRGGEIGHLRVDHSPEAPACDCGGHGHLACVASGRGVLRRALREATAGTAAARASRLWPAIAADPSALDNLLLVRAFHEGDAWACGLIDDAARQLGRMLAFIHLGVGTERFVIVGGFAMALGEAYRQRLVHAARESAWDRGNNWDDGVVLGVVQDAAGLIGAGRYAETVLARRPS